MKRACPSPSTWRAPLSAVPERVFFGNLDASGVATCTVVLRCEAVTAEEAQRVLSVRHDLGELLTTEIAPQSERRLLLRATLKLPPGEQSAPKGTMILALGDDKDTRISLPILGPRQFK